LHSVDLNLVTKTMDMKVIRTKKQKIHKISEYIIHEVTNTYN
jgi:hypothetical protein